MDRIPSPKKFLQDKCKINWIFASSVRHHKEEGEGGTLLFENRNPGIYFSKFYEAKMVFFDQIMKKRAKFFNKF